MKGFVVRQSIKDAAGNVVGYEILFQNSGDTFYNPTNDAKAADTIANFLMQNTGKIFTGIPVFITFTPSLLFRNTPRMFEPDALVIQIEDNVLVHPLANAMIQRYRKDGYSFAINDFQFLPRYFSMMEYVDCIKVDVKGKSEGSARSSLLNIVRTAQGFNKKCIATGVDTKADYELAIELNVDFLEGTYISDATKEKASKNQYLQGNFFQLVVAVTKEEPDMVEIEEIISRDAYLSYTLLKMVNSAYFAFRNKISSIRQALVTLGVVQLKQWVYLMSLQDESDANSVESLKLSFLRANFCSRLSKLVANFPITTGEAYIMGMFSTLDFMVDAPMEEILAELPIVEEIKLAIITHEGLCGELLELVLYYEKADWQRIMNLADSLGIQTNQVAQIYFDCVEEVNEIWRQLVRSSGNDDVEMPAKQAQPEVSSLPEIDVKPAEPKKAPAKKAPAKKAPAKEEVPDRPSAELLKILAEEQLKGGNTDASAGHVVKDFVPASVLTAEEAPVKKPAAKRATRTTKKAAPKAAPAAEVPAAQETAAVPEAASEPAPEVAPAPEAPKAEAADNAPEGSTVAERMAARLAAMEADMPPMKSSSKKTSSRFSMKKKK